eukprot:365984-Chlamydomonas_euryale.AAC.8
MIRFALWLAAAVAPTRAPCAHAISQLQVCYSPGLLQLQCTHACVSQVGGGGTCVSAMPPKLAHAGCRPGWQCATHSSTRREKSALTARIGASTIPAHVHGVLI